MITITVNGKRHDVDESAGETPLLYVLRNDLELKGPRFGCGLSQCGACTVHIDGEAVRSCMMPVAAVGDGQIVTLEGLGTPEKPHPVQKAFIDEQAAQCAYCMNGMIMQIEPFLRKTPHPTETQIREALADNLCRCGSHIRIIRAVKRAAETMSQQRQVAP
jgi:nicotinate dehydrogenase subunit A